MDQKPPVRIAIFASGGGSNARQIIRHLKESQVAQVALLASNKAGSGIFEFGPQAGIPSILLQKNEYTEGNHLVRLLEPYTIDLIVLAGYLKLIPAELIDRFPDRILNIHPALLPAYGGKGMYGMHVHRAVIENQEDQSGITIHFVNDRYDEGEILFQKSLPVVAGWSAEELQQAVLKLEHQFFPIIIEEYCLRLQNP